MKRLIFQTGSKIELELLNFGKGEKRSLNLGEKKVINMEKKSEFRKIKIKKKSSKFPKMATKTSARDDRQHLPTFPNPGSRCKVWIEHLSPESLLSTTMPLSLPTGEEKDRDKIHDIGNITSKQTQGKQLNFPSNPKFKTTR